jgi:hypothetical protein
MVGFDTCLFHPATLAHDAVRRRDTNQRNFGLPKNQLIPCHCANIRDIGTPGDYPISFSNHRQKVRGPQLPKLKSSFLFFLI